MRRQNQTQAPATQAPTPSQLQPFHPSSCEPGRRGPQSATFTSPQTFFLSAEIPKLLCCSDLRGVIIKRRDVPSCGQHVVSSLEGDGRKWLSPFKNYLELAFTENLTVLFQRSTSPECKRNENKKKPNNRKQCLVDRFGICDLITL